MRSLGPASLRVPVWLLAPPPTLMGVPGPLALAVLLAFVLAPVTEARIAAGLERMVFAVDVSRLGNVLRVDLSSHHERRARMIPTE
jgi:hypothetical protein